MRDTRWSEKIRDLGCGYKDVSKTISCFANPMVVSKFRQDSLSSVDVSMVDRTTFRPRVLLF